jgi:vancomycin resistance protein YoaR
MNIFSHSKRKHTIHIAKSIFWFFIGVLLGLFLLVSFLFIFFQRLYANVVYPGVFINGVHVGGKTENQIQQSFKEKNALFSNTQLTFTADQQIATISAKDLQLGFDEDLLAHQAYSIGRSDDVLSNISLILQAYINNLYLPPSYRYDEAKLEEAILPITEKVKIDPVNAEFIVENGRVTTFHPSSNGQQVDMEKIKQAIAKQVPKIAASSKSQTIVLPIPLKVLKPAITTEKVNNLGIIELIGTGTSLYQGSIPTRIHNVNLGASRVNGVLIPPGEEFSFNKTVGDVSSLTGYKQAYVIQNGKTVLGDGGGICQVSTTLFRAALNAGLPITERHAHAYRVHYYEEDSPPGIDATIYTPNIDMKFKNDTKKHILVQSVIDPNEMRLTFYLYGTKDNREVTISEPVIVSQSPAPEASYQDDPTLPKGTVKQVDFSAAGANIYFTRQVKKDGKITIDEKFTSNFKPWQAVYLRGTQE